MDQDIAGRLEALERKIDAIFVSTEKTRRYFLWTLVAMLVSLVLPLVGLLFAMPSFIALYQNIGSI